VAKTQTDPSDGDRCTVERRRFQKRCHGSYIIMYRDITILDFVTSQKCLIPTT
jgi:hypothetical protein